MPHEHPTPEIPPAMTSGGDPVDLTAVMRLLAAAYAGCRQCQDELTPPVVSGPPSAVNHIAGAAYLGMRALAAHMGAGGPMDDHALMRYLPPTRQLYRAFNRDDVAEGERLCEAMTPAERAEVLDDVLDSLVGLMVTRRATRRVT